MKIRQNIKRTCLLWASLSWLTPALLQANHAQSRALTQSIQQARNSLVQSKQKKAQAEQKLAQTEMQLGRLQQARQRNQLQQKKLQSNMRRITQRINQQARRITEQQKQLAAQWHTAAPLLLQPKIKYLLNKEAVPSQRLLTYTRILSQQCLKTLKALTQAQAQQKKRLLQQQQAQKKQAALSTEQRQYNQALIAQQKQRQKLIRQWTQTTQSKQKHLNTLLADQKALNQTLKTLHRPTNPTQGNFAQQRGKLPWPTAGHVMQKFGTKIGRSKLKLKGVLVQAPAGQFVDAVYAGRVVFARWLSGYGQLIIIDHGTGYMTLYGRTQQMLVKVGDTVKQGSPIATVGNTGGFKQPALYFALRHQDHVLNPANWCNTSS